MLLAADFMLQALWCPSEQKEQCDQVRKQFADHKVTLAYSELGGGSYYQHDLLWRVWRDYPATEWGERAFVLLLDLGWDTSGTCANGSDQFREIIRHGKSFLQQHPNSPYREFVAHLVGQAYATWWSLSNEPTPAMADYVDPKPYKEGSEQARLKAIAYFEQVLQHSPGTLLGEYDRQVLSDLRAQKLTQDGYRFFCVYD
jgi:outer membrane protein assembly factor BamD (BamD/ComL family)